MTPQSPRMGKMCDFSTEKLTKLKAFIMAFQTSSFILHSANAKFFNLSELIGVVIMAPHLVLFEHAAGYALFRSVVVIQNVNLLPSAG